MRSCSIVTGSCALVRPSLRESRFTWVSTMIPSNLLNAFDRITFAVFLATPGRVSKSSIVSGTFPLWFSTIFVHARMMKVVLFLYSPMGLMYSWSSEGLACAKSLQVEYRSNNCGVIRFTFSSVDCAERMAAIKSWSGLSYLRVMTGLGYSVESISMILEMLSMVKVVLVVIEVCGLSKAFIFDQISCQCRWWNI